MKIFVYGSLRQGFGNHDLLTASNYLGMAKTAPEYTMIGMGGFPGVIQAGKNRIVGEIYEIDDRTLRHLDRLESHPVFYRRTPITVETEAGDPMDVETYLLPLQYLDRNPKIIESGDWKNRTGATDGN